jgi:zinc-ribbon domain
MSNSTSENSQTKTNTVLGLIGLAAFLLAMASFVFAYTKYPQTERFQPQFDEYGHVIQDAGRVAALVREHEKKPIFWGSIAAGMVLGLTSILCFAPNYNPSFYKKYYKKPYVYKSERQIELETLLELQKLNNKLPQENLQPVQSTIAQEIVKIRCPQCKSLNEEDAKFCKNCGKEIG